MSKTNLCNKITIRYSDEEEQILNEQGRIYNISKSEVIRLGIRKFNEKSNIDILPKLCNLCSIANQILEKAEINENEKLYLKEELKEIWNQLE